MSAETETVVWPHVHKMEAGNVKDFIYDENDFLQFVIIEYECMDEDGDSCGYFERRLIQVSRP